MAGVESVGVSLVVPLSLTGREEFRITLQDPSAERPRVMGNRLTPGWFRTLRIPMRAGRDFSWDDRQGAPGVAIVNETLARRLGPEVIGMRLKSPDVEIVGVVADSKYWTIGETIAPTIYRPFRQTPGGVPIFQIRTSDLAGTARALRLELRRLAPTAAPDIKAMTAAVAVATIPARVGAFLTGAFGVLAAFLAALGIYGLVSFNVAQRQREIGVRKAIGAGTTRIISLIVGGTAVLAASGLAVGLIAAVAAGQLLRGLMVEVSPADPLTLAGVVLLVAASSLAASLGPALRAARIDPLATLRAE
jgi:ABC-type antimicrobial peptide transport system permease subunit